MNHQNFDTIKLAIYKIIKENGKITSNEINMLFKNNLHVNYCIDQLNQDDKLSNFHYKNGTTVYCFKEDSLFYKPLIR